jgi:hypothetical protein
MQTTPDNLTSLISYIQSRSHSERVSQPEHPALQVFVAEVEQTLDTEGPIAAAAHCGEALIAISGLLGLAAQGDPITLAVLASRDLTTQDLTQFGLWLDQRGEELTTTLS